MADIFGFETSEEALSRVRNRFAESRARVSSMGRSATPGQQLGSSLAAIFGPTVQKALDTRTARKEERQRLMDTQGLSEADAKKEAANSIRPEFREVRRAKAFEEIGSTGAAVVDDLITRGVPEMRARATGVVTSAPSISRTRLTTVPTPMLMVTSTVVKMPARCRLPDARPDETPDTALTARAPTTMSVAV